MSAQTLLFMDGWMVATPGVPEDCGSVELSSSITSSTVVPEPRLLLLIHLRNKIHHPHHHYILTLTHAHTPPIAPLSHQIGGGGQAGCETSWSSAQTKKPAECALASKRISDLSHCCFFTASTVLVSLFRLWCSPILFLGGRGDYKRFSINLYSCFFSRI